MNNRKRAVQVIELISHDDSALDFSDPNSSEMLRVSDLEFVFTNGTLYANAALLVKTCDFFRGVLVDTWHSTGRNDLHRCVYPMHEARIGGPLHKEVMLPLLHAAYRNDKSCITTIQSLFEEPKLFDEFLTFVDKIGWPDIHQLIHKALLYRPENSPSIYTILKKHSNFGSRPNFVVIGVMATDMLEVPSSQEGVCLEASFFTNLASEMWKKTRKINIGMFDGLLEVEDVIYYYKQFCEGQRERGSRLAVLKVLFLLDRDVLKSCIIELNLGKIFSPYEIVHCSQRTWVTKHQGLMDKVLLVVARLLPAK